MVDFPRILIQDVQPCVDAGRYPVKRVCGEEVEVSADLIKDGHDQLAAHVRFRGPEDRHWRLEPLAYDYDSDRWYGSFGVDRIGPWRFSIDACLDIWGTFCTDLEKRGAAGQDLSGELREAVRLLRAGAARVRAPARQVLERAIAMLQDDSLPPSERAERVGAAEIRAALPLPIDPAWLERSPTYPVQVDATVARFGTWYELFPRSQGEPGRHGTFTDTERRLVELAELGFDVVYLPPIHPIGESERKGPNNMPRAGNGHPGSPWAIGSAHGGHTAVHPELGTLDDFDRLVSTAKGLGIEIALDYALQCSPDHPWVREHPDWFYRRADGTIRYAENPPKKYQDIYPPNFWCDDRDALWNACLDVLRFWIGHGVRIFRVDNPHTKPLAFWEWAIGAIRQERPDVVFLAEAFTRPKRMYALAKLGFQQSYTYFTWKNEPWELRELMTELTRPPVSDFYRPNFFVNTPDILHAFLQEGGRPAFRIRLLLAATLSPTYGVYSGFELCESTPAHPGSEEYLDSEKYQIRWRDWDAPGNIQDDIRRINALRREEPALQRLTNLTFLPGSDERILWYRKEAPEGDLFIAVTLDPHQPREGSVSLPVAELGLDPDQAFEVEDLLDGQRYTWRGEWNYVRLDPSSRVGHVFAVPGLRGGRP